MKGSNIHGKAEIHIFISGISSVDVQPPHHREVAVARKVAHGFDRITSSALYIPNIVRVESNTVGKWFIMHPSLVNRGVPHLLPRRLVVLDRTAGIETSAPLGVWFLTATIIATTIDGCSCPDEGKHCSINDLARVRSVGGDKPKASEQVRAHQNQSKKNCWAN